NLAFYLSNRIGLHPRNLARVEQPCRTTSRLPVLSRSVGDVSSLQRAGEGSYDGPWVESRGGGHGSYASTLRKRSSNLSTTESRSVIPRPINSASLAMALSIGS